MHSSLSRLPIVNLTNRSIQIIDGHSELLYSAQSVSIYSPTEESVNAINISVDAINVSLIDFETYRESESNRASENNFDTFCSVQNKDFTRGCCISTSTGLITSAVLFLPGFDMCSLYITSGITSLLCICESMDIAGSDDRQYRAINFLSGMLIFPCLFTVGCDSANTAMNGCQEYVS
jgi:hypothetical protein